MNAEDGKKRLTDCTNTKSISKKAIKHIYNRLQKGIIKQVKKDSQRAKSLIHESERKINSLKEMLKKIGIKNENANDYIEYCYDINNVFNKSKIIS